MKEIHRIIKHFSQSSAQYLKISVSNTEILEIEKALKHSPSCLASSSEVTVKSDVLIDISSEYVGRYKSSKEQIQAGTTVDKNVVLGYIESIGVKHDIKTDKKLVVEEICIQESGIVEYGQVLFKVREVE